MNNYELGNVPGGQEYRMIGLAVRYSGGEAQEEEITEALANIDVKNTYRISNYERGIFNDRIELSTLPGLSFNANLFSVDYTLEEEMLDIPKTVESPPFFINEAEINVIKTQPGDLVLVKVKSEHIDGNTVERLRDQFKFALKDKEVQVFVVAMEPNDDMTIEIVRSKTKEAVLESTGQCGAQSYCADCSCGKKELMENT